MAECSRAGLRRRINEIIPTFDPNKADTENNKEHFRQLVRVPLSDDVTRIYASGDASGIDAKYALSFHCNAHTAEAIKTKNELVRDTDHMDVSSFFPPYPWWDADRLETLDTYSRNEDGIYFRYFWYDPKTEEGWFLDFDL